MRLVTAAEMRAIDRHAIETVGMPSLVLMENAGLKVLFTLEKCLGGLKGKRFTIICGKGNNGGDGLVVARHLHNNHLPLHVFLVYPPEELSAEARANLSILRQSGHQPIVMSGTDDLERLRIALEFSDCVIDALYGTGFSGEIEGYPREVVAIANEANLRRVAIDVPSGLAATTGHVAQTTFQAHLTVTLGAPKIGLFLYPGRDYAGEVWVADIGLPPTSFEAVPAEHALLTREVAASLLPLRPDHGHKGTFGHVLLLAGSQEYQGAGVLATYGALRSGAGLVTLGLPRGVAERLRCDILPDVIVRTFDEAEGGFALSADEVRGFSGVYHALVAGPGWGKGRARQLSLQALLEHWPGGLVLDADALNVFTEGTARGPDPHNLVLTPHLGEMSRLLGRPVAAIQADPIGAAREFVARRPCVLVLKAAVTVVVGPDGHAFLCSRPNAGLARGGAGDLLAGLIGGLLAQGLGGLRAALLGVFLHAEAGALARAELGAEAMTISEVASLLPRAFLRLRQGEPASGPGTI
ncbi:MAG: NAD(P)HX epimerase / NAD(P)HX dehydratase [Candidatus Ozemobacter sibiricus]|jgi:NAD(P)H-hydrate epimerase|uniref:Bifunctional NAD(P)H-hydrate repair enzyme n=1 Tax=Candidatus Ozemobacter sibiricus TaxID=2268124 RepID=A0A367ZPR4_9BACT|nr:MAG: NAD(P)HX epimerase / NAD(P)HX dehydratase [Candidatus Ozemobacter sibiricus]